MADTQARERLAALEAKFDMLVDQTARYTDILQAQLEALNELRKLYQAGIERAQKAVDEAAAAQANPQWSNSPLHLTEDEEDLEWQVENNIITEAQMQDMLKSAGFDTSIQKL